MIDKREIITKYPGKLKDGLHYANHGTIKLQYKNGSLHKEDGPAIECIDGRKEYWFNGKEVNVKNDEEFFRYVNLKDLRLFLRPFIIKQFESNLKFTGYSSLNPEDDNKYFLTWGLGDDSCLYFKGWFCVKVSKTLYKTVDNTYEWTKYDNELDRFYNGINFVIPLSEMIQIVNRFGNILAFI